MRRNLNDYFIAGVCSGIAEWRNVDPVWIRLAFVAAFAFFGAGPICYLVLWAVIRAKD